MVRRSGSRVCTAQWLAFARLFHFRVTRYAPGCRRRLVNVGVYQTEFEGRGSAQNLFRTRGILNTRQLNDDAIRTLTLDNLLQPRPIGLHGYAEC